MPLILGFVGALSQIPFSFLPKLSWNGSWVILPCPQAQERVQMAFTRYL